MVGETWSVVRPGVRSETVMAVAVESEAEARPVPVPVAEMVMVATPGATAVTTPVLDTVATAAADDV